MTTVTTRDELRRSRQIADALARHGLGYLIARMGLSHLLPSGRHHAPPDRECAGPRHLALALAELGATFIKLGQILSTRGDLLPPAYQAELARLQDHAPPVPIEEIYGVLAEELGQPVDELFAEFDPVPLAAASIGQVHAATLTDGTRVVVKVQRPGVTEQVEEDLALLLHFVNTAAHRTHLAERYDLVALAQEVAETLRAELDYRREGENAERFAACFAGNATVHIPRVYWQRSTHRVLTLERLEGIKIDDVAALDAAGIDRQTVAEHATRIILTMVFRFGFFHADPHPGNFFVEPDGRIALMDYGMVGALDEPLRESLLSGMLAVSRRDADGLADALLECGAARGHVDHERLRRDLDRLLARYYDRPLADLKVGPLVADAQALVREHGLQLPANLALLLKTIVMYEGLGLRLDPGFNVATVIGPFAKQAVRAMYDPRRAARRIAAAGVDAARLALELPRQLRRLLGELERGQLAVGVRPEHMEPLLDRLERLANRVVVGIIAAALINGLAVLMSVYHPFGDERWLGGFFAIGFFAAAALGLYLAWSIVRSK